MSNDTHNTYNRLFPKNEQHDDLYLVSSRSFGGVDFRIFLLPPHKKAIFNGDGNPPLNDTTVQVYGGLNEYDEMNKEIYGWLHKGSWQTDFQRLVEARRLEEATDLQWRKNQAVDREQTVTEAIANLDAARIVYKEALSIAAAAVANEEDAKHIDSLKIPAHLTE